MNEWSYIGAAYAITWLVFIGYALRNRSLERRAEAAYRITTGGA